MCAVQKLNGEWKVIHHHADKSARMGAALEKIASEGRSFAVRAATSAASSAATGSSSRPSRSKACGGGSSRGESRPDI
jgi:hypothetical protein